MTNKEFSDSFAVMLNSYAKKASFGEQSSVADIVLDEYEKSVFLTKAQEEVVINLYNGNNKLQKGFEETEELRRYLDPLIETVEERTEILVPKAVKLKSNSQFFELPSNLLFITLEQAKIKDESCEYTNTITVVPTTQDSYSRIKNNPFKGPTKYRVLRLDYGNNIVELVPPKGKSISKYIIRYLRKPTPIVLEDFTSEGLYVGDRQKPSECELNSILHSTILERAVYLALQSRAVSSEKNN